MQTTQQQQSLQYQQREHTNRTTAAALLVIAVLNQRYASGRSSSAQPAPTSMNRSRTAIPAGGAQWTRPPAGRTAHIPYLHCRRQVLVQRTVVERCITRGVYHKVVKTVDGHTGRWDIGNDVQCTIASAVTRGGLQWCDWLCRSGQQCLGWWSQRIGEAV